jgi:hypothetical protein
MVPNMFKVDPVAQFIALNTQIAAIIAKIKLICCLE